MTIELFKNAYLNYLKTEKQALQEQATACRSALREDDAKFALIEANIVDIFTQMFDISIKKNAAHVLWQEPLKESYLSFFDKIPSNWKINLEACQAHGLEDEAFIETLKLNRAATLKEDFLKMLSERG